MKQYVVDAFTDRIFGGNPAAICVLDHAISEELMQAIAIENSLSETAYAVKEGEKYHLRWFTPGGEIDLCGHATLGAAYVIMRDYEPEAKTVVFTTEKKGELIVRRAGDLYEMEFPSYDLTPVDVTDEMEQAFGARPAEAYMGRDLLCVFDDENVIRTMEPDIKKVAQLDGFLHHVTARGSEYDCVSRTFAPKMQVDEDPVCGSGHCHIVPYWSRTLGNTMTAYQASRRGGVLYCRLEGDKVFMAGKATLYSIADVLVNV